MISARTSIGNHNLKSEIKVKIIKVISRAWKSQKSGLKSEIKLISKSHTRFQQVSDPSGLATRGIASPSVMVGPVSSVVQLPKANLYAICQYGPIKLFTLEFLKL